MISRLRHRIVVLEKNSSPGPLGRDLDKRKVAMLWGAFIELGLDGRAKYQQIGHTAVTGKMIFRGPVSLDMSRHSFFYKGKEYEAVEPPGNPDTQERYITIVVRERPTVGVGENDGSEPGPL